MYSVKAPEGPPPTPGVKPTGPETPFGLAWMNPVPRKLIKSVPMSCQVGDDPGSPEAEFWKWTTEVEGEKSGKVHFSRISRMV